MKTVIKRRSTLNQTVLELPSLLQRIYEHRGIIEPSDLDRSLQALLPFHSLKGIEEAVQLLSDAIREQQRILIIGDFDADGATSSALAVLALKKFGAKHVHFLVPNRFEYGYGLTPEIVDVAFEWKPDLLITVDNGISSFEGVARAKELGLRVLITDHHLQGVQLPMADAIVNPNQKGDLFPSKHLAGVGVIFYTMLALRAHLKTQAWYDHGDVNLAQFLDLVALGTVADLVPLDKNNRILVYQGLQRIRAGQCRSGILALLEVSSRDYKKVIASDLSFAVGPRLNAAGRLDDMAIGINALLCDDVDQARRAVQQLDDFNKERRELEHSMKTQAFIQLDRLTINHAETSFPAGLCLFDETWHQGVIGIVASRIKEKYHRPVIAFAAADEKTLKGSARSIQGLHLRDVLDAIASQHPHVIQKFGGHAMAAGLTIQREHYEEFSQRFVEEVRSRLTEDQLQGYVLSDGELLGEELKLEVADLLLAHGPWGQCFEEPLFDGIFYVEQQKLLAQRHLKLVLRTLDKSLTVSAIVFNVDLNHWPNNGCEKIEIAYRLGINEYNGLRQLQLVVEHLREV